MSDAKPTDYKAEAGEWLDHIGNVCMPPTQCPDCLESLAALLERLCGEAREEGRREQREKDGWLGCGCRSAFVDPTCTMHTRTMSPFYFVDE